MKNFITFCVVLALLFFTLPIYGIATIFGLETLIVFTNLLIGSSTFKFSVFASIGLFVTNNKEDTLFLALLPFIIVSFILRVLLFASKGIFDIGFSNFKFSVFASIGLFVFTKKVLAKDTLRIPPKTLFETIPTV